MTSLADRRAVVSTRGCGDKVQFAPPSTDVRERTSMRFKPSNPQCPFRASKQILCNSVVDFACFFICCSGKPAALRRKGRHGVPMLCRLGQLVANNANQQPSRSLNAYRARWFKLDDTGSAPRAAVWACSAQSRAACAGAAALDCCGRRIMSSKSAAGRLTQNINRKSLT
jgi:hypothetical protein